MTLEEINENTCIYELQAKRVAHAFGQIEKCKTCQPDFYLQCDRYRPIGKSRLFFKVGIEKIRSFYRQNISLDSLPRDEY
jgi:hypothetical protein